MLSLYCLSCSRNRLLEEVGLGATFKGIVSSLRLEALSEVSPPSEAVKARLEEEVEHDGLERRLFAEVRIVLEYISAVSKEQTVAASLKGEQETLIVTSESEEHSENVSAAWLLDRLEDVPAAAMSC